MAFVRLIVRTSVLALAVVAGACALTDSNARQTPFQAETVAQFDQPWAMTFLPDGRLLVTEKPGRLTLLDPAQNTQVRVDGVPAVSVGGQGGFGDVVLHPAFTQNRLVYLSYIVADADGKRGAVVARAQLDTGNPQAPALKQLEELWHQSPRVSGGAHFSHRIAFDAEGHMFVSSGERRRYEVAQDLTNNLGKIVRLTDTGMPAPGNPFAEQGGVAAQIWTLGNRNPLGLAFAPDGQLWANEMGPAGGDELNVIRPGANYGYPLVSDGDHYDGRQIPDHNTSDLYARPALSWNPVISPAGLIFYTGEMFPQWQGSALMGGLSSRALVRVTLDGDKAVEADRFDMGERIREVEQGPDGAVWLLTDGPQGKLLRLTPDGS